MAWETVIGLEVHVELSTKTKIFCGCSTAFGGEPNAHTCPVCLGMPGALPLLNEAACDKAIAAGIALNCKINTESRFDRKHYFYPDLPNNYQVTQGYMPICQNGRVTIETENGPKDIRIHEIHIEEDAGKLVHEAGVSLVDFNRCGMPLIEIVSEPDMRNADEVEAYLEALRETLAYLEVSDCKMQEGSMRADINISVRKAGEEALGVRSETKNMNSIKAIKRAIDYETERHIAALDAGQKLIQETRRWDDNIGESFSMRTKEYAADYRYFPDPDIAPLIVSEKRIAEIRRSFPELAAEKRMRYIEKFDMPPKTAAVLTATRNIAELFDMVVSILEAKGHSACDVATEVSNIITGDILRLIRENKIEADKVIVDANKLATVIEMVKEKKINRAVGRIVIEAVFKNNANPEAFIIEKDLSLVGDETGIFDAAAASIKENPQSVADFKAGKDKAFGFLVGQTMRKCGGKADPGAVNRILKELLEEAGIPVAAEIAGIKNSASNENIDMFSASEGNAEVKPSKEPRGSKWKQVQTEKPKERDKAQNRAFKMSGRYRDLTCGELRSEHIGQTVKLAGWVMSIRDHGGIIFVDLRDMYGITQISCTEAIIEQIGKESSISVQGKVIARAPETYNPNIATGEVEIKAEKIELLGPCRSSLPFEIEQSRETREELRLKYRYLDLRNPEVKDKLLLRAEVIKHLRCEMEAMDFLEIQTPILANSSPEGARDYLVPSRKHKGMFYALPQAPQQFKQLLMVSGFDRYFQIAPCFRDEDARLDRSPGEFYQLDFEMAYATQEDVFAVAEHVLTSTFSRFSDKRVSQPPYTRLTYAETMLKYGSDKPDLRNPLEIIDLSGFFAKVDFAPFKGRMVRAINVPDATSNSKSWFRDMEKYALGIGMKGLGYIGVQEDLSYKGPIDKFLTEEQRQEIKELAGLKPGDVLYFICDEPDKAPVLAGQIRKEVAERLGRIDKDRFELCFITDYPMYEMNEETNKIDFTHNPFSMPQGEMDALLSKNPLDILAWQYDIVCNGVELSSGAVRNHRPDIMVKAFEIAGYSEKDVEEKFGALYSAFSYGAPPHAGMAPGVDRIIMLLAEEENIREIIAFPLNSNAQNLMLGAPGEVTEQQLREVHIKIR